MRALFGLLIITLLFAGCDNLTDASLSSRNTFIRLYEGPYDMTASDIERVADGYVILANIHYGSVEDVNGEEVADSVSAVVFKTDFNGNLQGEFKPIAGGTGKSIKQLPNGGYIVIGDYIKVDLTVEEVANTLISSAFVTFLNASFDEAQSPFYLTDTISARPIKTDYYGGSVTIAPDGQVFVLGTYVEGIGTQLNVPEKPFIIALNPDLTFNWTKNFDLIDRNYRNSKSVHVTPTNDIIWASSMTREFGASKWEYLQVSVVKANSTFVNSSTVGSADDQVFTASDIQPAKNVAFGYGIIGSFSEKNAVDGSKSNMFFYRTDSRGNIIDGSGRFFDAILSADNTSIDNTTSQIIDEGLALTATSDGGFALGGSMESIPGFGNGANDIYLVKVNAVGDPIWNRTLGGTGDEVVSSMLEAPDGGLVVCGTNTLGNAAVVFIVKTDRNGNIKD